MSSWNAPDLLEVYNAGMQVPGIEDNFEWKALVNSLQPYLERISEETQPEEDNVSDEPPEEGFVDSSEQAATEEE